MKLRFFRLVVVLCTIFLTILITVALAIADGVPVIVDCPADHPASDVWVCILPGDSAVQSGYYYNSTGAQVPMYINIGYRLSDMISSTAVATNVPTGKPAFFILSGLDSKRIYFSYGGALNVPNTGYTPSAGVNSTTADQNYDLRYQYSEFTTAGSLWAFDLSYIDFYSIPLSIKVVNGSDAVKNSPQTTSALGRVFARAAADSAIIPKSNVMTKPVLPPNKAFTRVLGTQLASQHGYSFYHNLSGYLTWLGENHVTANLNDCYVGGTVLPSHDPRLLQQQPYSYKVEFLSDRVVATANSGSGNASSVNICVGDGNTGTGIGDNNTLTILYSDLNSNSGGIYSSATPYTYKIGSEASVSVTDSPNDYFGRVSGDIFAGLVWGIYGSETLYTGSEHPEIMNKNVGEVNSMYWWSGKNATHIVNNWEALVALGYQFDKLQSNKTFYDPYAASFSNLTTGYGTPYGDRLQMNTILMPSTFDPGQYLNITIKADSVILSGPYLLLD